MDPRLLKEIVKQAENFEIDSEVFSNGASILDSISKGLKNSQVKIPDETQPSFTKCFRELP